MATANANAAPGATRPVDQHVEFVVKPAEDLILEGSERSVIRVRAGTPYSCLMLKNQRFSSLFRHYAKHHGLRKDDLAYYFTEELQNEDTPETVFLLVRRRLRVSDWPMLNRCECAWVSCCRWPHPRHYLSQEVAAAAAERRCASPPQSHATLRLPAAACFDRFSSFLGGRRAGSGSGGSSFFSFLLLLSFLFRCHEGFGEIRPVCQGHATATTRAPRTRSHSCRGSVCVDHHRCRASAREVGRGAPTFESNEASFFFKVSGPLFSAHFFVTSPRCWT